MVLQRLVWLPLNDHREPISHEDLLPAPWPRGLYTLLAQMVTQRPEVKSEVVNVPARDAIASTRHSDDDVLPQRTKEKNHDPGKVSPTLLPPAKNDPMDLLSPKITFSVIIVVGHQDVLVD